MLLKSIHTKELIKRRIEFLGITPTELGRRIGFKTCNQQQIFNIMKGKCQLPVKHIPKFARELGINSCVIVDAMTRDYGEALLKATIEDTQSKTEKTIG